MYGIRFNNLHSYGDMGLTIKIKKIGSPPKRKNFQTIPYMDGGYDFSNVLGKPIYDDRTLEYTFNYTGKSKEDLSAKQREIMKWVYETGEKSKLTDDSMSKYYFIAKCDECGFEETGMNLTVNAVFSANPYLTSPNYGKQQWDEFNFNTDYMNLAEYPAPQEKAGASTTWAEYTFWNGGNLPIVPFVTLRANGSAPNNCLIQMADKNGEFTNNIFPLIVGTSKYENSSSGRNIIFYPGFTKFKLNGSGWVSFDAEIEVL